MLFLFFFYPPHFLTDKLETTLLEISTQSIRLLTAGFVPGRGAALEDPGGCLLVLLQKAPEPVFIVQGRVLGAELVQ